MLANYRCNEIKNSILASFDEQLKELTENSYNKSVKNFKGICKEYLEKILGI